MKKLLAILLAFVTVLSFTACGGNEEPYEPDTPNEPNINPNTDPEPYYDDGSEYWGYYENDDGYLIVYDNGTYEFDGFDWTTLETGTWFADDGITFTDDYSGESAFFVLDEYGNLYGGEDNGTLFRFDPEGDYGYTEADYQGYWLYDNGYCLEINGESWYNYDDTGEIFAYGPVEYGEEAAYLMNEDGSSGGGMVYFDANGYLVDFGQVLTHYDEFPYDEVVEYEHPIDYLVGEWYYSDHENIITFYSDYTYIWEYPDATYYGTFEFDGETLVFYEDGSPAATASVHDDCIFVEGDAGSWYYRSDEF